jgi:hypothetical protein
LRPTTHHHVASAQIRIVSGKEAAALISRPAQQATPASQAGTILRPKCHYRSSTLRLPVSHAWTRVGKKNASTPRMRSGPGRATQSMTGSLRNAVAKSVVSALASLSVARRGENPAANPRECSSLIANRLINKATVANDIIALKSCQRHRSRSPRVPTYRIISCLGMTSRQVNLEPCSAGRCFPTSTPGVTTITAHPPTSLDQPKPFMRRMTQRPLDRPRLCAVRGPPSYWI